MQGDDLSVDEKDWASVSQIASMRGVARQAISKRAKKFRASGELPTRGDGKSLLLHLPTFEALAAQTHDPAQDLRNRNAAHRTGRSVLVEDGDSTSRFQSHTETVKFTDAAAREKNAKADLAEIRLAQQRGELIPAREIERAAIEAGTSIAQAFAALKSQSGKLYAASKGGEEALHIEHVGMINAAISSVGEAMAKLASRSTSETD